MDCGGNSVSCRTSSSSGLSSSSSELSSSSLLLSDRGVGGFGGSACDIVAVSKRKNDLGSHQLGVAMHICLLECILSRALTICGDKTSDTIFEIDAPNEGHSDNKRQHAAAATNCLTFLPALAFADLAALTGATVSSSEDSSSLEDGCATEQTKSAFQSAMATHLKRNATQAMPARHAV